MWGEFGKLFGALFILIGANNVLPYTIENEEHVLSYLTNFGYVDPQEMPLGFTLKDCNKKLMEFQRMARVPVSGEVDEATLEAMNTPRCGCPDFMRVSFKGSTDVLPADEPGKENNRTGHDHHRHHHHYHHHHHHHRDPRHRHHHHHHRLGFEGDMPMSKAQRFVAGTLRWPSSVVTYNIVKYPRRSGMRVSEREIEDAVHKAFNIWEQHINLEFSYQPNNIEVDIEISFESTYHNDQYPFDGPGKTLAHAFFPGTGIGGDVHFDEVEDWSVGTYNGVDVLYVTLHELGHSLGLYHSNEYGAVMYPMYRGYTPNLELHSDDIAGVQSLYGRKNSGPGRPPATTTTTTTTIRPRTTTRRPYKPAPTVPTARRTTTRPGSYYPDSDLCADGEIDGITTLFNDVTLVFKGSKVYQIGGDGNGVVEGWPKDIRSYFRGIEDDLDCVLTRSNGKTYFFKGSKYWRFTGSRMDRGYPRSIAEYFPGIPNNLDAAFEWDEEFVFVKGNQFWRFNTRSRPQVSDFFPMSTTHWGLRKELDGAFTSTNGTVYFFQDMYYWEFDKSTHQIKPDGQWPGLVREDWFGCGEP